MCIIVDIENVSFSKKAVLHQNRPNPFREATQIAYQLEESAFVQIEVFNALGQRVETLVQSRQTPGDFAVEWKGNHPGVYFYRLSLDGVEVDSKRMILW